MCYNFGDETDVVCRYGLRTLREETRRERFLEEMDRIVPWDRLSALVEQHYPKGDVGRPPIGVERMLRIMFLQHWFNLSDPAVEEALYDTPVMRAFAHVGLGRERVPDETTICKFRHLIERCDLSGDIFEAVALYLAESGIVVRNGTIVDATILDAPPSTKNAAKERDPEMHQTKKGNQWLFGMKGHVGIDSKTKVIHSVVATPANVHDSQVLADLLHGNETRIWGDCAYIGQREAVLEVAPHAQLFINRRGTRKHALTRQDRKQNRTKSRVRARVEHTFLTLKRTFPFTKLRYRGIDKNGTWLIIRCALVNLFTQKRALLRV